MEALTTVLSAMKLSGSVFLEAEFTSPWCVASQIHPDDCAAYFPQPAHVISYHYVRSGRLVCSVADGPEIEVHAGQIFLVPRNERHLLGSSLDGRPVNARELLMPPDDGPLARIQWGGGGERTELFCGFLGTLAPVDSFLASLPGILVIDTSSGASGEWLTNSIRYASCAGQDSPQMLGRLAELLFAEAVRQYILSLDEEQTGWLAAAKDSHVSRAITLIHSRCAEDWTTEMLAREAGLSRSAFADRFTRLIGAPPMRYLAHHRMNVAANMLREGYQNASNIAYSVGFNSEASFNRAFKKEFGAPPGAWRKEHASA